MGNAIKYLKLQVWLMYKTLHHRFSTAMCELLVLHENKSCYGCQLTQKVFLELQQAIQSQLRLSLPARSHTSTWFEDVKKGFPTHVLGQAAS